MVKPSFERVSTSIRIKKGLFPRFLTWCKNKGYGSTCFPLEVYMEGCIESDKIKIPNNKGGNITIEQNFERIIQKPRRFGKLRGDKDRVFLKVKGSVDSCLSGCGAAVVKVCHVVEEISDVADNIATEFVCDKCFKLIKRRSDFWKGKYWFKELKPFSFN